MMRFVLAVFASLLFFSAPVFAAQLANPGMTISVPSALIVGVGAPSVGVPAGVTPQNGDYYLDSTSGAVTLWGPYNSGWPSSGNPIGSAGPGVPTGGATGQVLTKNSAANYDTGWQTPGGGGGGTPTVYYAEVDTPVSAASGVWTTVVSKAVPALSAGATGNLIDGRAVLGSTVSGQAVYERLTRDGTPICVGALSGSRTQAGTGFGYATNYEFGSATTNCMDKPTDGMGHTYALQIESQIGGGATAYAGQRGDDSNGAYWATFSSTIAVQQVNAQ